MYSPAIRKAFLNAAVSGKDVNPDQLLSSIYGGMGGIFGELQGPIGAFSAAVQTPQPPGTPKPLYDGVNILKGL